ARARPREAPAATAPHSIAASRHLELTKPYTSGPKFTGPGCIKLKSTKTPISVSETSSAIGKLADTIMGPQPGQDLSRAPGVQAINDSVRAFIPSLAGTRPRLNHTPASLLTLL